MLKSIPYTTDSVAVGLGLKARGMSHEQVIARTEELTELPIDTFLYECTCCPGSEGHQAHCGTWLNEEG